MSNLDDDTTPQDPPVPPSTVTETPLPQPANGDAVDADDAGSQPTDPAPDPKSNNSPATEHVNSGTDTPVQDEAEPASSSSSSSDGEATSCSSDDEEENGSEGNDTLLTVPDESGGDCADKDGKNDEVDEQPAPADSTAEIEQCPAVEQDPSPEEDDCGVDVAADVEDVEAVEVVDGPENKESVDNHTNGLEEDTSDDVSPTDDPEEDASDNTSAADEDPSRNDDGTNSSNKSPPDDEAVSDTVPAPLEDDDDESPSQYQRYDYPNYLTTEGGGDASESSNMETTTRLREMADDSASRKEWILRKESITWTIQALDKIMLQHGIEEVKAHFLSTYDLAQAARERGRNLKRVESLSVCFLEADLDLGEMLVKLYIDLLQTLGFVSRDAIVYSDDKNPIGTIWSTIPEDSSRTVINIKHPYNDDEENTWSLRTHLADLYRNSSLDFPPVVVSHVPVPDTDYMAIRHLIKRTDYTEPTHGIPLRHKEDDLRRIFPEKVNEDRGEKEIEGGWEGAAMKRCLQRAESGSHFKTYAGMKGVLEGLRGRRSKRLEFEEKGLAPKSPDNIHFTKSDMLGHTAQEIGYGSPTWQELQKMIGMEAVKQSIREMLGEVALNQRLALENKPVPEGWSTRRCFIGPPGTGKTTIAKMYSKILSEIGLLGNETIVEKRASDLIGEHIGGSEARTIEAFNAARGGVLIIDEFHFLFPNSMHDTRGTDVFRAAIIDTVVAQVDPNSTRKEAIILIGYPEAMDDAFETGNPGLARRFPMTQAFRFEPYTLPELTAILQHKLTKHSLTATPTALRVAEDMLDLAQHRPNFGNGGAVDIVLQRAQLARNARCANCPIDVDLDLTLLAQDFDPDWKRAADASRRCAGLFNSMKGMGDVMGQFQRYQAVTARMRARGLDPRPYVPWALVFRGPPGTGKTTVARKMAKVYYDMGFLSAPEIVECSVGDVLPTYSDGSATRVMKMFERGLGKVLFIDEAYRLGEGRATDAIGEIVDCMTKERYRGKLVIVLAGYRDEMDDLMQENRGLRSRFATNVDFRPMKSADAIELMRKHLAEVQIVLDSAVVPVKGARAVKRDAVLGLLDELAKSRSWANGRDVIALARSISEVYVSGKGLPDLKDGEELGQGTKEQARIVFKTDDLLALLRRKVRELKDRS
ncbi:P-loop containing nucleoside triphosphate hydrolase protein [Chaetomium sp. MPI-SDFR-AT-0129]|nr:P-loop containing nucleoside triphosphate hydrolase protein [Chaetomium sp. MPI-SDFR-AT-0129]